MNRKLSDLISVIKYSLFGFLLVAHLCIIPSMAYPEDDSFVSEKDKKSAILLDRLLVKINNALERKGSTTGRNSIDSNTEHIDYIPNADGPAEVYKFRRYAAPSYRPCYFNPITCF